MIGDVISKIVDPLSTAEQIVNRIIMPQEKSKNGDLSSASVKPKQQQQKLASKTSRKGKKAWKKNIDITDLESQLDQLRSEERLGGKLYERDNESLFVIDKGGDQKVREKLKHKVLKIDQILKPQSAVVAPVTSRKASTVKITAQSASGVSKVKLASKAVTAKIKKMAEAKKMQPNAGSKKAEEASKKRPAIDDPWAEPKAEDLPNPDDYLERMKVRPVKKPKLPEERPQNIPAIKTPLPGASYNPTFEDHQHILQTALDIELEKEAKKEKLAKKLAYPPELDNLDDETFFASDDEDEDEEQAPEADDTADAKDAAAKKKENARKTKAQRNKEKARKQKEREEQERLQQQQLGNQIKRIRELAKEMESNEKELAKKAQARSDKAEQKVTGPQKLGPNPFKPQLIEIKLSEELSDSLRTLKPEGNLFKDRLLSLQERSIIETRVPVGKRQRWKKKETERHEFKRFDAETFKNL
ncbi:hypothetical protein HDU76_006594 [Blyttiomyces sp. JEL0837]|nr:hypothetical protein HDU76_006594 [Blyttiomyces sp. JEL0837]